MAIAGISWGLYSLWGRGAANPLGDTAGNSIPSVPLVAGVSLIALQEAHVSAEGVLLAILSGALTSGVGYVVWYVALRSLTATQAAVVQHTVPALAGAGGVAFLSERVSLRLVLSPVLSLGGVSLALRGRRARRQGGSPVTPAPSRSSWRSSAD